MKKIFTFLLVTATVLNIGMLTSCSTDDEDNIHLQTQMNGNSITFSPLVISVKVLNPKGNSTLSSFVVPFISATFRGQTFYCDEPSRSFTADFYGLKRKNDYLLFGEFEALRTFDKEEIILNWSGFAKPDTILFSNKLVLDDGPMHTEQTYWVNGKQVEGQILLEKDLSAILNEMGVQIQLSEELRNRIQSINTFGFKLFKQMMADATTPYGSTMASPMSVAYVLGMIADGAPLFDPTRTEILNALGFEDTTPKSDLTEMDYLFKKLIENIPKVDYQSRITMANALFCRQDYPIYLGYANHLANVYKADYAMLDFTSPEALETINAWSEQKTNGVIPQILDRIDPRAIAYFLNAIYFKGNWMTPFDESNTKQEDFNRKDGSKVKVDMMHNKLMMGYDATDAYTAVTTDMTSIGAYQMTFLLPNEGKTIEDVIQSLIDEPVNSVRITGTLVTLSLPRFTIEADHEDLIDQLKLLGIRRAFEDANLSEIWPQNGLCVSKMIQKTSIKVNEKGCEAAATTLAEFADTSTGIVHKCTKEYTFTADRPFVFLIREGSTGSVFFVGTYCGD